MLRQGKQLSGRCVGAAAGRSGLLTDEVVHGGGVDLLGLPGGVVHDDDDGILRRAGGAIFAHDRRVRHGAPSRLQ